MLEAVKILGEYLIKTEDIKELDILIENSRISKTLKAFIIELIYEEDKLKYSKIYLEDFSKTKSKSYLYRHFRHERYDVTLTSKLSYESRPEKTIEKIKTRWDLWFKYFSGIYIEDKLFKALFQAYKENKEKIFHDLLEIYKNVNTDEKRNSIITIKINQDDQEKYFRDLDIFNEIFENEAKKKFYYKHKVESKGISFCYLCKDKKEVYGYASPFAFFTVNKKGFAPNFQQAQSWKQLPICSSCALKLISGREFIDKYLFKNLYGYNYYVIPKFILGDIDNDLIEDIKDLESRKDLKNIFHEEDDILDLIKEKKNYITLIFAFCRRKQQYLDIVKYVEDIPPSWINTIYTCFENLIQKHSLFEEESLQRLVGKKWSHDFIYGKWEGKYLLGLKLAGLIRSFFPSSKQTGVYNKYFIDIIGDILAERTISEDLLIDAFLREIRNKFVNDQHWSAKILVLKSFYLYLFLYELNLIKRKMVLKMNEKNEKLVKLELSDKAKKLNNFFEEFNGIFNNSEKKALFSIGVLTKFLLDVQYAKRKSRPFRAKLYGLKLDIKKVKKLFPEIIEKLRQYDIAYPWLEQLISKYMIEADNQGWVITRDEVSYYFTLGLNLGKKFKIEEDKNE